MPSAARETPGYFRHWSRICRAGSRTCGRSSNRPTRTTAPCCPSGWSRRASAGHPGPVTLLGDAMHATSATGGNGANTALRHAALLGRCLIEAAEGRQGLLSADASYERQTDGLRAQRGAQEPELRELPPLKLPR
ncbi:hypothetical protein GTY54_07855 [Streptomyces sp. SID625]|nr:hypothetical protein [Streptomyces sp. SID625]